MKHPEFNFRYVMPIYPIPTLSNRCEQRLDLRPPSHRFLPALPLPALPAACLACEAGEAAGEEAGRRFGKGGKSAKLGVIMVYLPTD